MRAKGNVIWPTLLAVALSGAYLAAAPTSEDLAAATFRADLFAEHGFALWNNDWYSGHYLLSYSVIYPPLGALLGPRLTAALAVVAAVALFAILARRRFGRRFHGPIAVVRRRSRSLAAHRTGALPARRSVRPRRADPGARPGAGLGRGARGGRGARQPGGGPVHRARRRLPVGGRRAGARRLPGDRSGDPDRHPQSRLPHRRLRAVRVLRLHRDPAARGGRRLARSGRVPGASDRRRSLRAARPRPVHRRQPAGRQRHQARGAVCGTGARPRALASRPLARARGFDPALLLAAGGAGARRPQERRRSLDRARLLRPAAHRARPPRPRRRADPNRGSADQEPLGGGLRGARAPDRARLAATARIRGLRSVHRRWPRRGRLSRLASRAIGSTTSRSRTPASTTSPRTRWL